MQTIQFLGHGGLHERRGEGCQDRLSIFEAPNGTTILALSDGCSSSKFGGEAAEANLSAITNIFSKLSIDQLSRDSLITLYPSLKEKLSAHDPQDLKGCFKEIFLYEILEKIRRMDPLEEPHPKDWCATLLFAACEKDQIAIGHIGDGAILCYDEKGEVAFYSENDNGEESTQTYFSISDEFYEHFRLDIIPASKVDSLLLFSDGPFSLLSEQNNPLPQTAYQLFMKPFLEGKIHSTKDLSEIIETAISPAYYYIWDDWSMILAKKESLPKFPVSLNALFEKGNLPSKEASLEKEEEEEQQEPPMEEKNCAPDRVETLQSALRKERLCEALRAYCEERKTSLEVHRVLYLNDFCSLLDLESRGKSLCCFALDYAAGGSKHYYQKVRNEIKRITKCTACPFIIQPVDWFEFYTDYNQSEAIALRFYEQCTPASAYFEQFPNDLFSILKMAYAATGALEFCHQNHLYPNLSLDKVVMKGRDFLVASFSTDLSRFNASYENCTCISKRRSAKADLSRLCKEVCGLLDQCSAPESIELKEKLLVVGAKKSASALINFLNCHIHYMEE